MPPDRSRPPNGGEGKTLMLRNGRMGALAFGTSLVLAGGASLGAPAAAPVLDAGDVVEVRVVYPTHFAYMDGNGQKISDWIPLSSPDGGIAGGNGDPCARTLCFDGAEIDSTTGALVGAQSCNAANPPFARFGLDVGNDGNRLNDRIPRVAQGFQVEPTAGGQLADSAVIAWWWYVTGSAC